MNDNLQELLAKLAEHKEAIAQAVGARTEILKQIEEKFGVKTRKELRARRSKLARIEERKRNERDAAIAELKKGIPNGL